MKCSELNDYSVILWDSEDKELRNGMIKMPYFYKNKRFCYFA